MKHVSPERLPESQPVGSRSSVFGRLPSFGRVVPSASAESRGPLGLVVTPVARRTTAVRSGGMWPLLWSGALHSVIILALLLSAAAVIKGAVDAWMPEELVEVALVREPEPEPVEIVQPETLALPMPEFVPEPIEVIEPEPVEAIEAAKTDAALAETVPVETLEAAAATARVTLQQTTLSEAAAVPQAGAGGVETLRSEVIDAAMRLTPVAIDEMRPIPASLTVGGESSGSYQPDFEPRQSIVSHAPLSQADRDALAAELAAARDAADGMMGMSAAELLDDAQGLIDESDRTAAEVVALEDELAGALVQADQIAEALAEARIVAEDLRIIAEAAAVEAQTAAEAARAAADAAQIEFENGLITAESLADANALAAAAQAHLVEAEGAASEFADVLGSLEAMMHATEALAADAANFTVDASTIRNLEIIRDVAPLIAGILPNSNNLKSSVGNLGSSASSALAAIESGDATPSDVAAVLANMATVMQNVATSIRNASGLAGLILRVADRVLGGGSSASQREANNARAAAEAAAADAQRQEEEARIARENADKAAQDYADGLIEKEELDAKVALAEEAANKAQEAVVAFNALDAAAREAEAAAANVFGLEGDQAAAALNIATLNADTEAAILASQQAASAMSSNMLSVGLLTVAGSVLNPNAPATPQGIALGVVTRVFVPMAIDSLRSGNMGGALASVMVVGAVAQSMYTPPTPQSGIAMAMALAPVVQALVPTGGGALMGMAGNRGGGGNNGGGSNGAGSQAANPSSDDAEPGNGAAISIADMLGGGNGGGPAGAIAAVMGQQGSSASGGGSGSGGGAAAMLGQLMGSSGGGSTSGGGASSGGSGVPSAAAMLESMMSGGNGSGGSGGPGGGSGGGAAAMISSLTGG